MGTPTQPREIRIRAALATSPPALDERQRLNDEYMRGYRAASRMIDAASPEPALDVERLALAYRTATDDQHDPPLWLWERVAAEYVRLAEQPKEATP